MPTSVLVAMVCAYAAASPAIGQPLSSLPSSAEVVKFTHDYWEGLAHRFSRVASREGDLATLLSVSDVSCEHQLGAATCSYTVTASFGPGDVMTRRLQSDFDRDARGGLRDVIIIRESPRR